MPTPGFNFTSAWSQELPRTPRRSPPPVMVDCIIIGTHASRFRNAALPRKSGGRDTNHGERAPVERHGSADDRRIAREMPLPEVVAEDDDGVAVRRAVFFGQKPAAEGDAGAEDVEVVTRHELAEDANGIAGGPEIHRQQRECDQILDAVRFPLTEIDEVGIRDAQRGTRSRGAVEHDEAIGIGDARAAGAAPCFRPSCRS